jgi:antitoxin component of RelBE/YafQ-DinJ toxin-antitoxin module
MTEIFRCRVEKALLIQTGKVAKELGTSRGEIVRLCSRQLVKGRAVPFPLQAETPEDEILSPPQRRARLWDEMNEGKPSAR